MAVALVWRYVQDNKLWLTHPHENLRSRQAFFENLNECWAVRVSMTQGTCTQSDRDGQIHKIDARWGPGWYERVPRDIRPSKKGPDSVINCVRDLTKPLLEQIAIECPNMPLSEAIEGWRKATKERCDPYARVRNDVKGPLRPRLSPRDIKNTKPRKNSLDKTRRAEKQSDREGAEPTRESVAAGSSRSAAANRGNMSPRNTRRSDSSADSPIRTSDSESDTATLGSTTTNDRGKRDHQF